MRFSVLSSGSKANSTFLEASSTRILIDCGMTAKIIEERLSQVKIEPASIDAILITHEHSDHIKGASVFSRRHKIPVFANRLTRKHLKKVYAVEQFNTGEHFWVGGLKIHPFSIAHDAADPVGFVVSAEGFRFAQVTDLGRVTPIVREALTLANAIVLESNHDQEMLKNCDYSWELKNRIASAHGHLSNDTAGALAKELQHSELFHVVLGHLSENSNTPQLALQTFKRYVDTSKLQTAICASVREATSLIHL